MATSPLFNRLRKHVKDALGLRHINEKLLLAFVQAVQRLLNKAERETFLETGILPVEVQLDVNWGRFPEHMPVKSRKLTKEQQAPFMEEAGKNSSRAK